MSRDLRAEIARILRGRQPGELGTPPLPHRAHLVWAMGEVARLEHENAALREALAHDDEVTRPTLADA